jgi:hypothetical protein
MVRRCAIMGANDWHRSQHSSELSPHSIQGHGSCNTALHSTERNLALFVAFFTVTVLVCS